MSLERQTKIEALGTKAAALAVSMVLHALFFWGLPTGFGMDRVEPKDTVVVDLLEKTPGKAETVQQTSPEGQKLQNAPHAAEKGPESEAARAAERGRTAPEAQPPKPKKPSSEGKGRKADAEESPDRNLPPDPTKAESLEATVNLEETDSRYEGFLGEVRKAVNRQWNSRDAMLAAQRSGLVTLSFTLIKSGGKPKIVKILKSSHSNALDDEAERAVKASLFPSFPKHWRLERLNLVAQFEYLFNSED